MGDPVCGLVRVLVHGLVTVVVRGSVRGLVWFFVCG